MSRRSRGVLAVARRACPRGLFTVCAFVLALPLAALSVVPTAAFAHPARAAASAIGKTGSPAVDLTLHYRSALSGLTLPYRMGTDAAGNLYVVRCLRGTGADVRRQ